MKKREIMTGNEAIARGAYEAGITFGAAYPGTPSTEIFENLAQYKEIDSQWSTNEKVGFEVCCGAMLAGARSITAMKHVGLNVAADPFMSVAYVGSHAGFVIISADDPTMHSSQNEQDNRNYAKFGKIALLEPSDSQEAKDFVKEAIKISEEFDTPVLIRITTRIAHSKSIVELGEREEQPKRVFHKNIEKQVIMPHHARKLRVKIQDRMAKLEEYGYTSPLNKVEYNDLSIGIITSGISYQYAKEVMPDASYLKLGLTNPLPKKLIKEFSEKVDKLYIVEELDPFMEEQIKAMGIECQGKELLPEIFEFNPDVIAKSLLPNYEEPKFEQPVIPPRPPILCPGCPHRAIFTNLSRLKTAVTGDIGCYTLGTMAPYNALHTCIDMGASVSMALGLEKAGDENLKNKVVGVIGDSTFLHSGITGLIDITYNEGASVICILNNSITAMTGHQDNPGSGKRLNGTDAPIIDFAAICKSVGVPEENIRRVDAFKFDEINKLLKEELAKDSPSVIITEGPCIFLPTYPKNPKFYVDQDKCKKCGACFRTNCPAIEKQEDGKSFIHEFMCLGCSVCQQVCKFGAIQVKEGK